MQRPMILGIALTIVLYLLIAVTLVAQSHAAPDLIPREILFGNPVKASPQISPNGKYLSYLAPVNNVLNIWVRTLGERDDRAVTKDSNRGVTSYFWQEDGEHILYVQDTDGDENWRLYSVKIASEEVKAFTPFPNVQVRLIAHEKHLPHEVLIQLNKRDPTAHDVYHLDLRNGELTLLEENPGNFVGWLADHDLNIRGATVAHEDGSSEVLIRNNKEDAWRTLVRWEMEDDMNSGVVGFTKDATEMYLKDSRGVDTGRFIKINLQGETLEVIAEDPHYDFGGAMLHPDTYEVQTVSFTKERNEVIVLDEAIRADIETIKTLDSGDFFITSRDQALEKWVVGFVKDDGPVRYYLYEVNQKKGTFLFSNQPDLENYELSPIEPISYTTRDGLTIHGYLTMPPGMGRELLPMVLMVHGGPWARNTWGYDPRAQWVANRGYACLQVNYRGSTGYGKSFVNAGDKEWGGKMHDDLVDAVHWAIQEKIADPERLAIFGGSYGGYAALAGAAFTPDLFTCAVSIVGPSNLITFIKSVPPYWKNYLETIYRRVGNPETEVEFLKSRSPLTKVDNIKIPMLIGQGANDPRVKQAESEQIVAAMKEKGIQYEYLLFPDEGHGFVKPQNRLKFYQVAEKFLADHLGGRYAE